MQVRDLMTPSVRTVSPDMRLIDLERFLTDGHLSGAPVVRDRKLVGVVSLSDVVRQIVVERTRAEYVADPDSGLGTWHHVPDVEITEWIGEAVADHLEHLHFSDVMTTKVITLSPDADIHDSARVILDNRVHRVLVVQDGEVRRILSTTDLVRLFANGYARN